MKKIIAALAAFAVGTALFAGVAPADELVNDVDVENSVKQATITSGGAGESVDYWIVDSNDNECDVNTGQPFSITVNAPVAVTASPASLSFTQSECASGAKKSVTFTSSTPGVHAITHDLTFQLKGGDRSLTNLANFTLNVLPRAASGLQATAGDAKVDLAWTASPDSAAIDGYRVYQGGTAVATVTGTSHEVTGLTNGTQYCFKVRAYKGLLESADSNEACATPVAATVNYDQFIGFDQPVDNMLRNTIKGGQAVPLKWRLLDHEGNPITDLAQVKAVAATTACNTSVTADPVEEIAAGASGLQNLGDGYYQLNWKTPKGTGCRSLQLQMGGLSFAANAGPPALIFELR